MRTNQFGAAAILLATSMLGCSSEDDVAPQHTSATTTTTTSGATVGSGGETTGAGGADSGGSGTGEFVTADHEPFPQIEDSGGPILEHVQLVTVTYPDYPLEADVQALGDWIVGSDWLITVGAEYGVGKGDHVGKIVLPEAAPAAIDDAEIQAMLVARITDGTLPAPPALDNDYLYMVYFPESTKVTSFGSESCVAFGGYHISVDTGTLRFSYAVMPECGQGIQGVSGTASHELIEAATDAFPLDEPAFHLTDYESSWSALGGEVADLCVYGGVEQGGFFVTRSWSNASAAAGKDPCVPAPAGPNYNVSPEPQGLQLASRGEKLTFTLTGWSTEPIDDWTIIAYGGGGLDLDPKLDVDEINNGGHAKLTVTVPQSLPPQSFGTVAILSAKTKTQYTVWPVGIYIP